MEYTESNFYCYKLASWFRFIHVAGRISWKGFKNEKVQTLQVTFCKGNIAELYRDVKYLCCYIAI